MVFGVFARDVWCGIMFLGVCCFVSRYVMLAAQSSFKGKSDRDKYEKAMRLKGCIDKIRDDYTTNLTSKDTFN